MAEDEIVGRWFSPIAAKRRSGSFPDPQRTRHPPTDWYGSKTKNLRDSLLYLPERNTCEYETMYENIFSVLMVVALGILAGCVLGLLIGFALGKQKPVWSEMTPAEKRFNGILVIVCSVIAIAGLGWYSLLR